MKDKSGSKKLYGLLGKNISYSLSPVMHNAAFEKFRINAEYTIFDKQEEDLEAFMREEILTGKVSGINVTVPYKIIMKDMVEKYSTSHLDGISKYIGAVNTIRVDKNDLSAWNTDTWGFYDSLREVDFDLREKTILVLGAGGAGRAICLFLALMNKFQVNRIYVYDIDERNVGSIIQDYKNGGDVPVDKLQGIGAVDELQQKCRTADLIVNATPIGTKDGDPAPINVTFCKDSAVIYDLVYARETELLKQAKGKGLKAVNGLGMLVGQGARSFYYWTEDHWNKEGVTENEALDKIRKEMFKGIEKS